MKIGGFQKQSLIDYPGNISAVVFTQGCNFRCSYCHNPELVLPKKFATTIHEDELWAYLERYSKLLDAVCITGGEPTLHSYLPMFIRQIKQMGLKVKLDTNGSNPEMIKQLLKTKMVDYIAMDIKHQVNIECYSKVADINMNQQMLDNIKESINLIQTSNIQHEFRTTNVPELHSQEDIAILKKQFGQSYKIQHFKFSDHILNPGFYQGYFV